MDPTNPVAQGQQDDQSQSTPAPEQNAGIQKRIDELVAKAHESERTAQQLMATVAEQQATIAQMNARQVEQPQVQEEQLDPSDPANLPAIIQRSIRQATEPLQKQIQQLSTQRTNDNVQTEMQAVQAKLQKLNNPAVTARVQQLLSQWRRDGRLQQGQVTPGNAYFLAVGEAADGTLGQAQDSNTDRQQFNGIQPLTGAPQNRQPIQQNPGNAPEARL